MCSCAALYFVRSPCPYGFKATGVYLATVYYDIQCLLSCSYDIIKRSAILRFFLMSSGGGGGGGYVELSLRFNIPPTWTVWCIVFRVFTIGLIRLRFGQCSFVVDSLFIYGCSFYGSITLRMSTRRLSVVLFVFSFRVTVISCYLLRGVPVVAEEFFVYFCPTACNLYDFS